MEKLSENELEAALQQLSEWSRQDEKWIVRKFRFPSFKEAVAFVNQVADIAEDMNHHPMIALDFKMVTVRLTSWKAQGISSLDIGQAGRIDSIYQAEQVS